MQHWVKRHNDWDYQNSTYFRITRAKYLWHPHHFLRNSVDKIIEIFEKYNI